MGDKSPAVKQYERVGMRRDSWSAEEYLDFDVEVFFMIILKIGLVLGMIGPAVNLWCDRALSITPNGKITLATMKEIDNPKGMEKLYEGVDASIPMKSAVLGVMSLVLQFFGYFSIAYFVWTFSEVFGILLYAGSTVFAILGSGHHMKYALGVWMFIKGGRDKRAYELLRGLYHGGNATRLCYFGYILYVVALMVSICMGVCGLTLWALVFTVLPILIVLFPFKIIGTLHISAIITFLGWIFIMDI